jgi:hypothetical protein
VTARHFAINDGRPTGYGDQQASQRPTYSVTFDRPTYGQRKQFNEDDIKLYNVIDELARLTKD